MVIRHVRDTMRASRDEKLLAQQVQFLEQMLTRGRKKAFENVRSHVRRRREGGSIIDQWEFIDYQDAGDAWQKTSQLYCECGRKLRYQYTLENKQTGLRKSFGLNHLTEHTGIPPELARLIVNELRQLMSEQEELIEKWTTGWTLRSEGITRLPPEDDLPKCILRHLRVHMPLLQRQVKQVKKVIKQRERMEEEKKLQAIVAKEIEQLKQDK